MNKLLSLQKYLQKSVDDSRREIRQKILDSEVKLNFTVKTDPQELVEPGKDIVHYKNKITRLKLNYQYYLLNKPKNVITSLSDPQGRAAQPASRGPSLQDDPRRHAKEFPAQRFLSPEQSTMSSPTPDPYPMEYRQTIQEVSVAAL